MAYHYHKIHLAESQNCINCGQRIALLDDHLNLALFLGEASAQRRGYRCMNCGQVTCFECSRKHCQCACGSNAWVALPYLERTAAGASAYQNN